MSQRAIVLGHQVKRTRGAVHLFVTTDEGSGTLHLTPTMAEDLARDLTRAVNGPITLTDARAAAMSLASAAARGLPLTKPSGGL